MKNKVNFKEKCPFAAYFEVQLYTKKLAPRNAKLLSDFF